MIRMMTGLAGYLAWLRLSSPARRYATLLAIAALLAACEGGSGQSGSAFTFLSVDGFSLSTTGSPNLSTIP